MLQLLAQQKAEYAWTMLADEHSVLWLGAEDLGEGTLVLVELSAAQQVQSIQGATEWVLGIIQQYLATGITPEELQEEVQRAEQWRQSLTLQSQELGRRSLEMEARRDQIQELEENLKQEKKKLESMADQIRAGVERVAPEDLSNA